MSPLDLQALEIQTGGSGYVAESAHLKFDPRTKSLQTRIQKIRLVRGNPSPEDPEFESALAGGTNVSPQEISGQSPEDSIRRTAVLLAKDPWKKIPLVTDYTLIEDDPEGTLESIRKATKKLGW